MISTMNSPRYRSSPNRPPVTAAPAAMARSIPVRGWSRSAPRPGSGSFMGWFAALRPRCPVPLRMPSEGLGENFFGRGRRSRLGSPLTSTHMAARARIPPIAPPMTGPKACGARRPRSVTTNPEEVMSTTRTSRPHRTWITIVTAYSSDRARASPSRLRASQAYARRPRMGSPNAAKKSSKTVNRVPARLT